MIIGGLQTNTPEDCYVLIPRAHEYVLLHRRDGKKVVNHLTLK